METNEKQKMFEAVIQKAWEDVEFKASLIADPLATLEEFLGRDIRLPEGKDLAFVDQSDPHTLFINIPERLDINDMELDEDQLDVVAGGGGGPIEVRPDTNFNSLF